MRRILTVTGALVLLLILSVPVFASPTGRLSWGGDVDDVTVVTLHRHMVSFHVISGKSPTNIHIHLQGGIGPDSGPVTLGNWSGRGQVVLVRQPNPHNDFTAVVRISDPQGGRGHYHFVLTW